jgi:DDE superfamily endonuclease
MKEDNYSLRHESIRHSIVMSCGPRSSCLPLRGCQTNKSVNGLICPDRSSPNGANVSLTNAWPVYRKGHGAGDPALFPPEIIVAVKALACQLPKQLGLPFSRFTHDEIARQTENHGIVASISGKTVWRWLSKDAIRPWCYRSWIWPRDPDFQPKAGRVLDLYQGIWEGKPLSSHDFIICSDEKTSVQARHRLAPVTAPTAGRYGRVEHEYERMGALAYMAAWDVRQAKIFGLCRDSTGIASFRDLVDLVMRQQPYRSARRVFWVTDNGSSHRGQPSINRLKQWYPNAIQVHTPIHASWLNQVEIYFSVLQRKVLTPNDFESLDDLEHRILCFQTEYEKVSRPFEWKFTREDLKKLLSRFEEEQKLAA